MFYYSGQIVHLSFKYVYTEADFNTVLNNRKLAICVSGGRDIKI